MAPGTTGGSSRRLLPALTEGKRFEAYAERQTAEMRVCFLCEKVHYRRKPLKRIGTRWVCLDCLRSLKEALDGLGRWEEISRLREAIEETVSRPSRR